MLKEILELMQAELQDHTGLEVTIDHAHKIDETANADSDINICLVNIEEDSAIKNQPNHFRDNGQLKKKNPPVYINAYLLCTASNTDYPTSLEIVNSIGECFQKKSIYTPYNTPTLPASIDKLTIEWYNLNMEQLNHLWGIHGGKYFPSILYKLRLLKIEASEEAKDGPEITDIQIDSNLK